MSKPPRCVVITGGGRGVGAAVARRLVDRGVAVVLASRTERQLLATRDALCARSTTAMVATVVCDVSSAGSVAALADRARAFAPDGWVDGLVNNAGIVARAPAHEMDEATWDAVMDTNAKGAWLCTRAFLAEMIAKRRGRIVCVGSISSTLGSARASAYCASKWALVGFAKSVAEETRELGVQVMSVLPGSIDTEMLAGSGFEARMSADDVARTVEFLCLDAPDALTGTAVEMFG